MRAKVSARSLFKGGNEGSEERFDLVVIGAGSAGFSAAITAADEGAQVALIGHGTIGGTCVNVGCVPSKALIRAVEPLHHARAARRFAGIEAEARVTDWAATVRQKRELVEELRRAKYIDVLPSHPRVRYIEGAARLAPDGAVEVEGRRLEAPRIIIATGSRPHVPEIPGLGDVPWHDSTSLLELEEVPDSLIVIGGGYIGVELAQILARAGSRVSILTRHGLLPRAEPEISQALTGYFAEEGITVRKVGGYERVEAGGEGVVVHVPEAGEARRITAEALLVATGRVPNSGGLGLEEAGVATDARGGIVIDAHMRTSRAGVYAAGDVTGRDQFVYMAAYGAKIAARNALQGDRWSYDNSAIPSVVFSDPQVASVGMTEAAARAAGHDVRVSVLPLEHVPRAIAARDTRGLIKLVADAATHRLLGAHVLAPEGADSIQAAAFAIRAGMGWDELGDAIFPYLTTVEGLKLAAQTFEKDVAALSCCAG
ncbi:mercuric reductase [Meinhardsimonia xiamenensis]|jgi:mercuric reductase|uniref:Mercuric reductase n=1 Tax=Meinhardsimonia xiamenensis TaxID=990712 RepID=A0A1G8XTZ1_9RHOB|nr:mercury(II) reductase [Meinhardsimonia xiamenensis]PRX37031.1 mercuric reductase [Meinhardsimonia xiamenensis]SDJ93634.1 mercuric reductase [Meinhardsimonia xiamenensis]